MATKLWAHQAEAVKRARGRDSFALFFEPGTGKTLTTLEILKEKYTNEHQLLNTLILAPLVVLDQWKEEIKRVPDIPIGLVAVLKGSSVQKIKEFERMKALGHNFIAVTNYESLYNKTLFNSLCSWTDVLVCDESSKLKDRSAQRTRNAIKISKNAKYRYLLSGTPILNSLLDIFSQYLILDHGETFGGNYLLFRSQYFVDMNASWKSQQNYFPNWVPKHDSSIGVSEAIKPSAMHVRKVDAIDLPAYTKKNIYVEMGREQAKAYAEMRDYLVTVIKDRTCAADMVLTKLLRLQQIVSGFIKFDDDREKAFDDVPRIDALSEILQEVTPIEKVIVWCVFKRNYLQVKNLCDKLKLPHCDLTGETIDKAANIARFNTSEECRVMIANQQAGGIGVNLTAAGTSIFYSKSFSLEADVQAEARNFRGGSLEYGHKKITRIDLVCRETIDEIINSAIEAKVKTNDEVLSLLRSAL